MKKIITFVLLGFLIISANAQIVQKNEEGQYRIISQNKWENTEIRVEKDAQAYINFFSEAISRPGTVVIVEKNKKILKLKLMFKKLVETKEKGIKYDETKQIIRIIKTTEQKEEPSYLILLGVIPLILMVTANILLKKYRRTATLFTVFSFFAAVAAFSFAAAGFDLDDQVFDVPLLSVAFFAAGSSFFAVVLIKEIGVYRLFSVVYCLLMTIYSVLLLT